MRILSSSEKCKWYMKVSEFWQLSECKTGCHGQSRCSAAVGFLLTLMPACGQPKVTAVESYWPLSPSFLTPVDKDSDALGQIPLKPFLCSAGMQPVFCSTPS